jgi:hypothetical protein
MEKSKLWIVVLGIAIALGLMPVSPLMADFAGYSANFAEFDADYGSSIDGTNGDITDGVSPNVHTALGRKEGVGEYFYHLAQDNDTAPYMGTQMYKSLIWDGDGINRDRSEIIVMGNWDYTTSDTYRYFSVAFFVLNSTPTPTDDLPMILCQFHQDGASGLRPPITLTWKTNTSDQPGHLLLVHKYYDNDDRSVDLYDDGALQKGKWYHFLFKLKPGLNNTGIVELYKMNLATGIWESKYNNQAITVGFAQGEQGYEWKVGQYRGPGWEASRVYYDNVRYGRLFNHITKNRVVGSHQIVMELKFDENSGTTANDTSGELSYMDYNNDAALSGTTWSSSGKEGSCLYFNSSDYARVTLDKDDFDFGNYVTFSCWFKASSSQAGKVLMCQDYDTSGTNVWKARLYFNASNKLDFSVRHPDDSIGTVRATRSTTFSDGIWHHVVGTYNRFASDGYRLKIYIDGELSNWNDGGSKPILRGNTYFYIGRFNGTTFNGYIDEVMLGNYAMTADEVEDLYDSY